MHGGRLLLESELGVGTTVSVILPHGMFRHRQGAAGSQVTRGNPKGFLSLPALLPQRPLQERQADIHPVVDIGVIVGKLLISVGDLQAFQRAVQTA